MTSLTFPQQGFYLGFRSKVNTLNVTIDSFFFFFFLSSFLLLLHKDSCPKPSTSSLGCRPRPRRRRLREEEEEEDDDDGYVFLLDEDGFEGPPL